MLVSSLFAVSPLPVSAQTPVLPTMLEVTLATLPHESAETDGHIRYLFERAYAEGKDPVPMAKTIYCESQWYNVQSGVVTDGVREESYGIAQIHLPSHPAVTKEDALSPTFAIDFMITNWEGTKWYGYDRENDVCTNTVVEYWL